jgi:hypothetical protein
MNTVGENTNSGVDFFLCSHFGQKQTHSLDIIAFVGVLHQQRNEHRW